MKNLWTIVGAALLVFFLQGGPLSAGHSEVATVESAGDVLRALSGLPVKHIPPALLQDAQGVAIIPGVFKAGFVLGGRFGRGVVLARGPGGAWSNPVFVTLMGGGIGWQIGIQSTDVVLVFKTKRSLDRILSGHDKITLGADIGVAAGPVGRQAEAATDGQLRAEIYSYSRSRGLFAGVSLEGAGILVDFRANEAFYRLRGGHPTDVLTLQGPSVPPAAARLQGEMGRMTMVFVPAPVIIAPPPRRRLLVPAAPPVPPPPPPPLPY